MFQFLAKGTETEVAKLGFNELCDQYVHSYHNMELNQFFIEVLKKLNF